MQFFCAFHRQQEKRSYQHALCMCNNYAFLLPLKKLRTSELKVYVRILPKASALILDIFYFVLHIITPLFQIVIAFTVSLSFRYFILDKSIFYHISCNPLTAVLFTSFESHDIILLLEECRVPATVDARTPE